MPLDLALVMPVYNEESCIRQVVESWKALLQSLNIDFQMLVLNDGSTDRTAEELQSFTGDPFIEIINKRNSGHGPTVLMGYRNAANRAHWVFQCDSDDEMKPDHFPVLWNKRQEYDALFGVRVGMRQSLERKLVSMGSRLTVRLLFGKGVVDVNTPYRLIRSHILASIVRQIPEDAFAPNVIISGALAKANFRILNHPVPHQVRRTGQISIANWKLYRGVLKSFIQTWHVSQSVTIQINENENYRP